MSAFITSVLSRLTRLGLGSDDRYAVGKPPPFNRPILEAELADLEGRVGVGFPDEYREFLTVVGNGCAALGGLYRLGTISDDGAPWYDEITDGITTSFPHRRAWNLPEPEIEAVKNGEPPFEDYWAAQGAVPIRAAGCGLQEWLIVTGDERGHVWHDARVDHEGWYPWKHADGAHMTFGGWVLAWLDDSIERAEGRLPAHGPPFFSPRTYERITVTMFGKDRPLWKPVREV